MIDYRIILNSLEKEIILKREMYSKFERDLAELKFNDEFVTNFIASFLNAREFPIKHLKFYRNSMSKIVLSDLTLTQSKIYLSAISSSTIINATFDEITIIDSVFTWSRINKSKFINCKIESSLFDQVIFEDVDFSGSEFKDVYFAGADLTKVNFKGTKGLKGIYFYNAKIDKARCQFDDGFEKELDEIPKTEEGFKEYVNNESDLGDQNIRDLFKTLEMLKPLFSWDSVPGNDNNLLLDFIKKTFDISRVENAEITKSEDGRTLNVFAGEKSVEITLNESMDKAVLKTSDGLTYNLRAKDENGKLNIYRPLEHDLDSGY